MHWLKKSLALIGLGALGMSALGQEPAVRLGTPTPWRDVRGFTPFTPAPPVVVRGVAPMLDDEPKKHDLPRDLPPLDESKLVGPPVPAKAPTLPNDVPSMVPVRSKTKDVDAGGAKSIAAVADAPAVVSPAVPADSIILIDGTGRPIIDSGLGGPDRFYAKAEWLLWWSRGFRLPALVVTDSPNTPLDQQAILGNGTTQVLFGNSRTGAGGTSGGRFTAGYSLDECGVWAIEGNFFFIGRKNQSATFTSDEFPVLGRPFFDLNNGVPFRELLATPGFVTGAVRVETSSSLFGAEINLRRMLTCPCSPIKITGLAGFRALNLSESLRISETSLLLVDIPVPPPDLSFNAGDVNSQTDRFDTRNRFFGGQIGAAAEMQRERWIFELRAKVAIGATYQTVDIDGSQQVVGSNGRNFNFNSALFAVNSNSGRSTQTRVGFVPEVGVNVGYQLTDNLRVFAGYDFLYWSSVLRPGDQIDQGLDLNRVNQSGRPVPPIDQVRPRVPFQTSSYWAQGVNAGLLLRY